MLTLRDICFSYGKVQILYNINLSVREDRITGLIGSNGGGKTTTIITISGIRRAFSGSIQFCEERIEHLSPHKIASRGLIHIPEGRELFPSLSTLENLEMGCAVTSRTRLSKEESLKRVFDLFPVLMGKRKQLAGSLSGGEQQMLAIGRGLMSLPRLLMLDEPSLGLSPFMVNEVFRMITWIKSQGVTILVVEQNARKSLEICDKAFVMENGRVSIEGTGADLLQDERVKLAYLGL